MKSRVEINLTKGQVENLARPIARMGDAIMSWYDDPKNQKGYEEWHLKKYGVPASD